MSIEMISLIGIIVGIVLFIGLMLKGVNIIVAGITSAILVAITSGSNPITMITDTWATGFSAYMKSMFLVFLFGCVFGRLLSDSGGAKRIAMTLYNFFTTRKGDQRFYAIVFLIVIFSIMSYSGISGFVVIFSIYNVVYELFRRLDVPWNLYGYGGAAGLGVYWITGSLHATNIAMVNLTGQTTTVGSVISLASTIVFYGMMLMFVKLDLRNYDKKGEGFFPAGREMYESKGEDPNANLNDTEGLPGIIPSVLPIVVMVICAGRGLPVALAIFIGCIVLTILMWKHLDNPLDSLTQGVTSSFSSICNVSSTSALAALIRNVSGFAMITSGLSIFPTTMQGVLLVAIFTFVACNGAAAIQNVGEDAMALFTAAGMTQIQAARLLTLSCFTGAAPHNAGITNVCTLCKIKYKEVLPVYFRGPLISGFCAMLVGLLLIKLGVNF